MISIPLLARPAGSGGCRRTVTEAWLFSSIGIQAAGLFGEAAGRTLQGQGFGGGGNTTASWTSRRESKALRRSLTGKVQLLIIIV
jgi:hypothetical protein